jgi:hypothetical protein
MELFLLSAAILALCQAEEQFIFTYRPTAVLHTSMDTDCKTGEVTLETRQSGVEQVQMSGMNARHINEKLVFIIIIINFRLCRLHYN